MLLLFLISLTLIYIFWGLLTLAQIVVLTIVFFTSNFLMGLHPFSKHLHVIRILSIVTIVFILYYNTANSLISLSLLLPLSLDKISIYDENKDTFNLDINYQTTIISSFETPVIEELLKKLNIDDNYVVTIDFTTATGLLFGGDAPVISLSRPILINRNSNASIISEHINSKLEFMVDIFFNLDDSILCESDSVLILNFTKIIL